MNSIVDNQQELAKWVREQNGRLDLAVAFWGEGATAQLGLRSGRKARILLDLTAGATNPKVVEELQKMKDVQVKQRDRLHAKLYLGQKEMVVGSANASANGLGAEGHEATHWCELGIRTACPDALAQAAAWFERQWSSGRTITPRDLANAKKTWKSRRRLRPTSCTGSILDIARTNPGELKDRRIYVSVSTLNLTQEEEEECKARAMKLGEEPLFFYDWRDIPLSAALISFMANTDGSALEWDEPRVCISPDQKPDHNVVLVKTGSLPGYKLGSLKEWRKRISYHVKRYPSMWSPEHGGICVEITRFVGSTNPALS